MGGGGHPHAAGFEIDKKRFNLKSKSGRELFLAKLSQEASRLGI
jgi:nanoRNase/pAp phosphatase (c-di-AMP/oligoRNAs hydrolase)